MFESGLEHATLCATVKHTLKEIFVENYYLKGALRAVRPSTFPIYDQFDVVLSYILLKQKFSVNLNIPACVKIKKK